MHFDLDLETCPALPAGQNLGSTVLIQELCESSSILQYCPSQLFSFRNVKGTSAQRDLESTLVEMEDKENMRRLSQLPPCPLPAAVYETGTIAEEIIEYETGPEYNYIPEAYGTVNSSAKVTKHVARVKVGSGQQGLKWNESCLVSICLEFLFVFMPLSMIG